MSDLGFMNHRSGDDPRVKEAIMSQLHGEAIGFLKSNGLKDGEEFKSNIQETFSCSRRIIHIYDMDESFDEQIL